MLIGLMVAFFLLRDAAQWYRVLLHLVPIENQRIRALYQQSVSVIRAILVGQGLIALANGLLCYAVLWALGYATASTIALVSTMASLVPVVGSTIVWIPVAIAAFVHGEPVHAISIAVVCGVIGNNIDTPIRMVIVGRRASTHPLVPILGGLGGLALLGPVGLVVGPVVLSLATVTTQSLMRPRAPCRPPARCGPACHCGTSATFRTSAPK
jgi:predicted PurR-regulated permease PerM